MTVDFYALEAERHMSKFEEWLMESVAEAEVKVKMLTGGGVTVKAGGCKMIPLFETGSVLGDESETLVGVGMTLMQDPPLKYLMLMTTDARDSIVASVAGEAAVGDRALADSLLQEIGNIYGSVVANCFSRLLDRSVPTSIPEVVSDLAGAMVSTVVATMPDVGDQVMMLEVGITAGGKPANCGLYLFLGDELERMVE